jgi:hypothetical protein
VAIPDLAGGPHLVLEALLEHLVLRQLALQHLDGDDIAVPFVGCSKDQARATLADQGVKVIRPERVAGLELTMLLFVASSHGRKDRSAFGSPCA